MPESRGPVIKTWENRSNIRGLHHMFSGIRDRSTYPANRHFNTYVKNLSLLSVSREHARQIEVVWLLYTLVMNICQYQVR